MNKGTKALTMAGLLLSVALAAPAAAQDLAGLYLGGSIGQASYKYSCMGATGTCDDEDTGYKLFGGYQFNRNMALELGYANLDNVFFGALGEATVKAGDLSAILSWPVSERFALIGRAGIYRSQVEVHPSGASEHNSGWTFGLGADLFFTPKLSARAEWQRYNNVGGASTGKDDIDYLSVGFVARF